MVRAYSSSVSPKGQVTIPAEVRRQLRIRPKDRVTFEVEGDEVRLVPAAYTLESACGSVPALDPPRDPEEVERIAKEEVVQRYLRKMRAE